jgi:hypothetical protein
MKQDLKDITFLILVRIDTIERMENLLATTEFLLSHFDTTINVLEVSSYNNGILKKLLNRKVNFRFVKDDDPIFYRTKYLNNMLRSAKTPYVSVWDADVLATVEQITETMNILRTMRADFVYPYRKKLMDTTSILRKLYMEHKKITFLSENIDKMKEMYPPVSVGGAFFCKLESYINIGLENEDFYGWGVEDGDRFLRWKNSAYKIERTDGVLFHLSHPRGINSLFHKKDQMFIKKRIVETTSRKSETVNTIYSNNHE